MAQRRRILERLDWKPRSLRLRLVPLLAPAVVLFVVILWYRPVTETPARVEVSDTQIFEDVFSRISASEPLAVEPLRSLFEVTR